MARCYLVGAGPGDPRLLTLAALEALQDADVVLCDRLVTDEVLSLCNTDAEIIYVGKSEGQQERTQNTIFEYFAAYATTDKTLVRIKGGDPYVFGRGSEEYLCLKKLGYDVIAIPGISSAVGLPTLAGIPLTARNLSGGFAVLTGHNADGREIEWSAYAKIDTLVVLMAVKDRASIAACLIEAGRCANEPVAFIENGGLPGQRVVRATLNDVKAGMVEVDAPAVFIIGPVTALYDRADSREKVTNRSVRLSFRIAQRVLRGPLRVLTPVASKSAATSRAAGIARKSGKKNSLSH